MNTTSLMGNCLTTSTANAFSFGKFWDCIDPEPSRMRTNELFTADDTQLLAAKVVSIMRTERSENSHMVDAWS